MAEARRSLARLNLITGLFFTCILSRTLLAQNLTDNEKQLWWEKTIVYEIWPRSFQDSDDDGSGDIQGIVGRLDYFVDLGVETIWLNAIYPSPLANSGYDVSDYGNVDPRYGDLEDFDQLITAAHELGLKVILDFVPNHSSILHPWFNSSVNRIDPYTDYYVWHDGILDADGANVAPNNWKSVFYEDQEESSAWQWNEIRGQWYLHQFSTDEADLDLRNAAVVEELLGVLDFWLNRGVDGFYIHGVPYFLEDENFQDNSNDTSENTFGHVDNAALLYKFREHVDAWISSNDNETKFLAAEGFEDDENLTRYYGDGVTEGVAPVNLFFVRDFGRTSNATYFKDKIDRWMSLMPRNETTNWKLSSHDYSRAASRYDLNRADGLNMLLLSLPGRVFTYYGEEIAMTDNEDISYSETVDSAACAAGEDGYSAISRDPHRTPMQWDASENAGFTAASATPYLPVNANYQTRNVATQKNATKSYLNTYKKSAALRSKPALSYGDYQLTAINNDRVLVLVRSLEDYPTYVLLINLGLTRQTVNITYLIPELPSKLNVSVTSSNAVLSGATVTTEELTLTANAAVMITDDVVVVDEKEEGEEEEDVTEAETETENPTTTDDENGIETTTEEAGGENETTTQDSGNSGFAAAPTTVLLVFSLCFSIVSFRQST